MGNSKLNELSKRDWQAEIGTFRKKLLLCMYRHFLHFNSFSQDQLYLFFSILTTVSFFYSYNCCLFFYSYNCIFFLFLQLYIFFYSNNCIFFQFFCLLIFDLPLRE